MDLDLEKHPVSVINVSGAVVAHFSNYMCAARTVARSHGLAVQSEDGRHYDRQTCIQDEVDWDFAHAPLKGEMRQ